MAGVLRSVNPATGRELRSYEEFADEGLEAILEEADNAFRLCRRTLSVEDRAAILRNTAAFLRTHAEEFAWLMAEEMGKPVAQGRAEVEKCASCCEYYAEHGARFLAPEPVATDAKTSYVAFEPLGILLAIMPWNFPFWQAFRAAAPALMAGNAVVLKHASNVSGCSLAIERVFTRSCLPQGLFRSILVDSGRVAGLIRHPRIKAVTITGSTRAGRSVAAAAGAALKKTVLELGGSDPYVILEDADLEQAAATCAASRLINSGQSCIAAKRFIVVEPVRRRFEALFVERMKAQRMGDPLKDDTTVGPLARTDLRAALHDQVQRSVKQGARVLLGGAVPAGPGAYYPPTVLTEVRPGMAANDEETFGPVAAIIPAKNEADAIRIANEGPFGLGAAVFTRDLILGERIAAKELEAGACFVNAFVRSDPRLPFGGIKESGYGRELSAFGIREFVNIKTVYVAG